MELRDVLVETQILPLLQRRTSTQLVEYMVVSLREGLEYNTRAFEQVCPNTGADDFLFAIE